MPNDFESVKARCLPQFRRYLETMGLFKSPRSFSKGALIRCPFPNHDDRKPSALFYEKGAKSAAPFIVCQSDKCPYGGQKIGFQKAIQILEGLDGKAAWRRMLDFCGERLEHTPAPANYEKAPNAFGADKAAVDDYAAILAGGQFVYNKKPTEPAAHNASQTQNKAQQAAPLEKVGQSIDFTELYALDRACGHLTAGHWMSQAEIFERTRAVLKRANPQWTDAELNSAAVADAQMQFQALKHFGGKK